MINIAMVGWNARMDGFQGAVLSVKLKHLDQWNESRRKNAELYNSFLKDLDPIVTPAEADYAKHIYHIYPILTENRQQLMDGLAKEQISCGIHYPVPLHLQAAYNSRLQRRRFSYRRKNKNSYSRTAVTLCKN